MRLRLRRLLHPKQAGAGVAVAGYGLAMSSVRRRGRVVLVYFGFLPGAHDMLAPEASTTALLCGAIAAGTIFGLLTWLFEDRTTVSTIVSGMIFGAAMFAVTLRMRSRSRGSAP